MIDEALLIQSLAEADEFIRSVTPPDKNYSHSFSVAFRLRMRRLIEKDKHPVFYEVKRVAAAIILAVLVGGAVLLGTNETVRASVWGWVKSIYEGAFRYRGFSNTDLDISEYSIADILPEGYEEYSSIRTADMVDESYVNSEGFLLTFFAKNPDDDNNLYVYPDEGDVIEQIVIGKYVADLYINNGDYTATIVWQDNQGVLFCLSGHMEKEQIRELVEKIIKKINR